MAKFKGWMTDNIRDIPILGQFTRLGEAIGYFSTGDIKTGLKSILGMGLNVIPGGGALFDWLFGEGDDSGVATSTMKSMGNAVGNFKDFIVERITNLFSLGARGASEALGKVFPKSVVNEGLRMFGLDDLVDKDVARGELYGDIQKLEKLKKSRENASKVKGRGRLSEYDRRTNQIQKLRSDIYGAYDLEMIRSTRRGIYEREKAIEARQAKKDAMMFDALQEMINSIKEVQTSSNIGVNNSQSNKVWNVNV
jgi:hypothetical protein